MKKYMKQYMKHIVCLTGIVVLMLSVFIVEEIARYSRAEPLACFDVTISKEETVKEREQKPIVQSLKKITDLKVYRSTEAALISWKQVENAQYYKIYRHAGKKGIKKGSRKWSGSWKYLGKVSEKNYISSTYNIPVREYVDIRYKKKSKRYDYKKYYTYKVVAVNRNVTSPSVEKYSTRWKMKKNELSYYTLYLTNKERKKLGKSYLTWGHAYNKGSLLRAKDMKTQAFKSRNKWHNRPNGDGWFAAFKYLPDIKDPTTEKTGDACAYAEDVGVGWSCGTKDVFEGYMNSPGHRGPLMVNQDEKVECDGNLEWNGVVIETHKGDIWRCPISLTAATYSSNILKDKNVFHEAVVGFEDFLISANKYRNHK